MRSDIINHIIDNFVESVGRDESIAAMLRKVMKDQLADQRPPKNYYYVTHLSNPAKTYWSKIYPEVEKPPDLARKLARGKQLQQRIISPWIRTFPDLIVEEGTLDGIWVGLPGVRGKIDYRIGDSILELKTKNTLPKAPEEMFSLYAQDLEQLVFYSVIHPSFLRDNYLVFVQNSYPYDVKAFKVITKDRSIIKKLIIDRIKALNDAIERKDPSKLGRCRYFVNCQFNNLCSCKNLEPISTKLLEKSVEIFYDADFTEKLESAKKSCEIPSSILSIGDVIAPRKHYMKNVHQLKLTYSTNIKERREYLAWLWESMTKLPIKLSKTDKHSILKSQREYRILPAFRWAKFKSSFHTESDTVPYLLKVSSHGNRKNITDPSEYHKAELGILCSIYGKTKGLIIVAYPKLDNFIQVFQITYKDVDRLLDEVKKIVDNVEISERQKNLLSLPACPEFMNDDKNCPLMEKCHSEKGSGCTDIVYP